MAARAGGSPSLIKKVYENPRIGLKILRKIGPIIVREVDGKLIRDKVYIDFTEGGNSEAYAWFPQPPKAPEIWLDTDVSPDEMKFVLLHELREFNEMKLNGVGYETAHKRANDAESKARRDPKLFSELLNREIARVR